MRAYDFETYDVFTRDKFAGNQLAVIMDGQGLSTEEMQTITREFNLSETTFVLPPENRNNTARVRIFTLGYEMPFAGHPTVGTAIAIARSRGITNEMTLELNAGLFPIALNISEEEAYASFINPNLPEVCGEAPSAAELEAALSLPAGVLDNDQYKPKLISAGAAYVYARATMEHVSKARIDSANFNALGLSDTVGVYLYAEGGEMPKAAFHARMFAPDAGIPEDPATGSAAAAFPGHIVAGKDLSDGEHRWLIEQGFEMGRPSLIHATVAVSGGNVASISIGGNAVPVQTGQIVV